MNDPIATLADGGKRAIARQLVALETDPWSVDSARVLDAAWSSQTGFSLGLTGPPGVGKSTLLDALIREWRGTGQSIAVIAVDPSSSRTGGALLGDRTRFSHDPSDPGVFVRSMAARDRLGGVADQTFAALVLLRALFDLVVVETVGVGQSETDVSGMSDMTALCIQPGSGDALQFIKAGIIEVPGLFLVTKGDMRNAADRAVLDLKTALAVARGESYSIIKVAAPEGIGIPEVVHEICTQRAQFQPGSESARAAQLILWRAGVSTRLFGSTFAPRMPTLAVDNMGKTPFCDTFQSISCIKHRMSEAFG